MRNIRCPVYEESGDRECFFRHRISMEACIERQAAMFHRCHDCLNLRKTTAAAAKSLAVRALGA